MHLCSYFVKNLSGKFCHLHVVSADENPVSLMIERDSRSYVLCTLQHGKHFQQPLDLEFASGEELTLFIKGNGLYQFLLSVHLNLNLLLHCICVVLNVLEYNFVMNFV